MTFAKPCTHGYTSDDRYKCKACAAELALAVARHGLTAANRTDEEES